MGGSGSKNNKSNPNPNPNLVSSSSSNVTNGNSKPNKPNRGESVVSTNGNRNQPGNNPNSGPKRKNGPNKNNRSNTNNRPQRARGGRGSNGYSRPESLYGTLTPKEREALEKKALEFLPKKRGRGGLGDPQKYQRQPELRGQLKRLLETNSEKAQKAAENAESRRQREETERRRTARLIDQNIRLEERRRRRNGEPGLSPNERWQRYVATAYERHARRLGRNGNANRGGNAARNSRPVYNARYNTTTNNANNAQWARNISAARNNYMISHRIGGGTGVDHRVLLR